ncbi:uncharacterized protein N7469_000093 [Penicillium citrinum]|uniref:Uncharacterized protein n=2 Tax=Penicillium TaxID=5073 RepID=A0A9W9TUD2_PENCI|nr:uncharacterized protein N7469_000093 [Penicillium citrinum]KAJ5241766.1 hypothetical protein N7469_000093 [Penicillium citrinum]KAJ5600788.1 hypothetical protein N7450_001855 [Penicillium hetheringtonii]
MQPFTFLSLVGLAMAASHGRMPEKRDLFVSIFLTLALLGEVVDAAANSGALGCALVLSESTSNLNIHEG